MLICKLSLTIHAALYKRLVVTLYTSVYGRSTISSLHLGQLMGILDEDKNGVDKDSISFPRIVDPQ
jgi:hypothetical protein